jgi:hypothetical protein
MRCAMLKYIRNDATNQTGKTDAAGVLDQRFE